MSVVAPKVVQNAKGHSAARPDFYNSAVVFQDFHLKNFSDIQAIRPYLAKGSAWVIDNLCNMLHQVNKRLASSQ